MSDTTGHRLSEVDRARKTAICIKCGPTDIYYNEYPDGRRMQRCKGATKSVRVTSPKRHTVLDGMCGICGPVDTVKGKCPNSYAVQSKARWKRDYQELRIETDVKQKLREGKSCEICGKEPQVEVLHIDHKKGTKHLRGILCGKCNAGLGMFDDDPDLFRAAAMYLERP